MLEIIVVMDAALFDMELLIIHVVDLAQPSKDVFLHINGSVKWYRCGGNGEH